MLKQALSYGFRALGGCRVLRATSAEGGCIVLYAV